jgi:pilus assembly protein CpaC
MHYSNRGQSRVLIAALALCICAPLYAQSVSEAGAVTGSVAKTAPGTAAGKGVEAASGQLSQAAAGQAAPQPAQSTPQAAPAQVQPAQLPEPAGEAPLRVMVDKSILVNTTEKLKRVSVTDPSVADALVVTPNQVLVHGRAPGEVSLILWNEEEQSRAFDLRVDVDSTAAAEEIQKIFPAEKIHVTASRSAIVLSGHVSDKETAERVGALAAAYSKAVVNVLTWGPIGSDQVLLEVKFAEVDRTALSQYGLNLFSTGAANTIGSISTQQFGTLGTQTITDSFGVPASPKPNVTAPTTGPSTVPFTSEQTISDVLNLFIFRPDIHLGAFIKALQEKNLLQILAEPNLIAVNGKEANFLAGGEFPYPIVQPSSGSNAITIQFKEFGVRVRFLPVIMPNGSIRLQVRPEVSALDFTNALTISGFVIPALSTRRAETEVELQDGQSFVLAGLLDNRVTKIKEKLPFLGDIPILGNLFNSENFQKSRSELMVMVTARRVFPSVQLPPGVAMPEPSLDPKKFDGKTQTGSAQGGSK